jgi:hypothetical protein
MLGISYIILGANAFYDISLLIVIKSGVVAVRENGANPESFTDDILSNTGTRGPHPILSNKTTLVAWASDQYCPMMMTRMKCMIECVTGLTASLVAINSMLAGAIERTLYWEDDTAIVTGHKIIPRLCTQSDCPTSVPVYVSSPSRARSTRRAPVHGFLHVDGHFAI